METKAQHIKLDVWVNEDITQEVTERLCNVIRKDLTVVKESSFAFEPQGETIVFILSESHFSMHTYPEHHYLSMDLYVCNMDINLDVIGDHLLAQLNVDHVEKQFNIRGVKNNL